MATKQKKPTTAKKPRVTAKRSSTKTNSAPTTGQFVSTMVTAFAVLSIVFLLVVIQSYV